MVAPLPPPTEAEEADPELRTTLAASVEVNDLEDLAEWMHLAEVLRTSVLEEEARWAREDTDAWAFLTMVRRQEETTRQATLREKEERHVRLKHEPELQAAAVAQREKEAARLARLRRPARPLEPRSAWERAQWSPWSESPVRSGVSSHNSASLHGGVIVIDADARRTVTMMSSTRTRRRASGHRIHPKL
jgi:hypothetical protein